MSAIEINFKNNNRILMSWKMYAFIVFGLVFFRSICEHLTGHKGCRKLWRIHIQR